MCSLFFKTDPFQNYSESCFHDDMSVIHAVEKEKVSSLMLDLTFRSLPVVSAGVFL